MADLVAHLQRRARSAVQDAPARRGSRAARASRSGRPRASACRRTGTPCSTARSSTMRATGRAPIRRPHHGRRLDGFGLLAWRRIPERADRCVARASGVQSRLVEMSTSAAISDRASRAEHAAHALDDGTQRDNRGHADGDADEEEQQPPPGGAGFARRHAQTMNLIRPRPRWPSRRRRCARRPSPPALHRG